MTIALVIFLACMGILGYAAGERLCGISSTALLRALGVKSLLKGA